MFYYTYCNNSGHIVEKCYLKHDYPLDLKFKRKLGRGFGNTSSGGLGIQAMFIIR